MKKETNNKNTPYSFFLLVQDTANIQKREKMKSQKIHLQKTMIGKSFFCRVLSPQNKRIKK